MKKITTFSIMFLIISTIAQAEMAIPHKFTAGDAARASEVNANFDAIAKFINEKLVVMYDYGTPTDTTKIFAQTASPTTLTAVTTEIGMEIWEYSDGRRIEHLKKCRYA